MDPIISSVIAWTTCCCPLIAQEWRKCELPKSRWVDRVDVRISTRTPGYRPFVTSERRSRRPQSQRCLDPINWCIPNSFPIILCHSHHHHLHIDPQSTRLNSTIL